MIREIVGRKKLIGLSTHDMDEILHSEIELIKNDYHRCDNCKK